LILAGLALGSLAILVALALNGGAGQRDESVLYHRVARGRLDINVTVSGAVESQQSTVLRCEVEDLPNDGQRGTSILWIV
jgi:hypothetical protein